MALSVRILTSFAFPEVYVIVDGLHEMGWSDVPVVAAETSGASSFAEAVKAGQLVTLTSITSIAKTLGART